VVATALARYLDGSRPGVQPPGAAKVLLPFAGA
jgi:hypothetical protein